VAAREGGPRLVGVTGRAAGSGRLALLVETMTVGAGAGAGCVARHLAGMTIGTGSRCQRRFGVRPMAVAARRVGVKLDRRREPLRPGMTAHAFIRFGPVVVERVTARAIAGCLGQR